MSVICRKGFTETRLEDVDLCKTQPCNASTLSTWTKEIKAKSEE